MFVSTGSAPLNPACCCTGTSTRCDLFYYILKKKRCMIKSSHMTGGEPLPDRGHLQGKHDPRSVLPPKTHSHQRYVLFQELIFRVYLCVRFVGAWWERAVWLPIFGSPPFFSFFIPVEVSSVRRASFRYELHFFPQRNHDHPPRPPLFFQCCQFIYS